jgi:hypothetical protein
VAPTANPRRVPPAVGDDIMHDREEGILIEKPAPNIRQPTL